MALCSFFWALVVCGLYVLQWTTKSPCHACKHGSSGALLNIAGIYVVLYVKSMILFVWVQNIYTTTTYIGSGCKDGPTLLDTYMLRA